MQRDHYHCPPKIDYPAARRSVRNKLQQLELMLDGLRIGNRAGLWTTIACVLFAEISFPNISSGQDALVTAVSGSPYGIATLELPVAAPVIGQAPPPLQISNDEGRVLFPIASDVRVKLPRASEKPVPEPGRGRLLRRFGNLIREIAGKDQQLEKTVARRVTFLIQGDQPLNVRLSEANIDIGEYEIRMSPDENAHRELLGKWWTDFTAAAKRQIDAGDYPPWVENYMVAMLSGQTQLPLPNWYLPKQEDDDLLIGSLELLASVEAVGETIFRRAAAGDFQATKADRNLPAGPDWKPRNDPEVAGDVPIEDIAMRVPPECLYLRFGAFSNYLWFRDLSDEYGGDLSRMITLRGFDDNAPLRVENQLNMKMNQMTRMLGPTIIEDQVLIGRDLFMSDGATIGVILKPKNTFLLTSAINADRKTLASGDPHVTLTDIKIDGKPCSLLSSGDNRVRSYFTIDNGFCCVANSETLIKRFLEVGKSGKSLGKTQAFRLARKLMPVSRGDTVFAYFSPDMLQGLVDPRYLIELRRRLHAKSDIALVHIASAAAKAAGKSVDGVDALIRDGFLPQDFGRRADGSGVVMAGGEVIDTLRGARGSFLPIADSDFDSVTDEELTWYNNIRREYESRVPEMDPIMIGVQRQPIAGDNTLERLVAHAEIAPLVPEKYGWVGEQLGAPTKVSMQFAPDDIVTLQAHVASPQLGPPTHLFAGIKDTTPPAPEDFDGLLGSFRAIKQLPAYLGAWPQPHAIDRLPLGLGRGRPVGENLTRLLLGVYRFQQDDMSVLSFHPEVLESTLPFLRAEDVEDLATVRAHVGTLEGSQLQGWVNNQLYQRAAASSTAGANFLSLLSRQLKVEPPEALEMAAKIFGDQLQCPLGGKYEYSRPIDRWVSTAWKSDRAPKSPPRDYIAPILKWFRGADATAIQYADRLVVDANVVVKRQK